MRLGLCLVVVSFAFVYVALADEELRPVHRVKRNRFQMKDKSVVYTDSVEGDASPPVATVTLPPTTKKPETSEEVSDLESESKRLAQKMKEGVGHINLADYINDEEADASSSQTVNKNATASTPSQKGEQSEASNFSGFYRDPFKNLNCTTTQTRQLNVLESLMIQSVFSILTSKKTIL